MMFGGAILSLLFGLSHAIWDLEFHQHNNGVLGEGWRYNAIVNDAFTGCYQMGRYANAVTKIPYTGEDFTATREIRFYANNDCTGKETNILAYPSLRSEVMLSLSAGTGSFWVDHLFSKNKRRGGSPVLLSALLADRDSPVVTQPNFVPVPLPHSPAPTGLSSNHTRQLVARASDGNNWIRNGDVFAARLAATVYALVAEWQYNQVSYGRNTDFAGFPSVEIQAAWADRIERDWNNAGGTLWLNGPLPNPRASWNFYLAGGHHSIDVLPSAVRAQAIRAMRWASLGGANWVSYDITDFTGIRVIGTLVISVTNPK